MSTVRDAMVSNPGQLPGDASAQAAGDLLQRPEVRAVYVTEDERLIGVLSRSVLQRRLAEDEDGADDDPLQPAA